MQYSLTVDSTEPAPIARRPSLVNSLLEFRFPIEAAVLFWNYWIKHLRPQVDDSNRKIVMMIPGFMAGDLTLAPLAKFCEWLGHKTFFIGICLRSFLPTMIAKLTTLVQDNYGRYHRPGEHVDVVGQWMELGTHRMLLRVVWADGTTGIALPADLAEYPVLVR